MTKHPSTCPCGHNKPYARCCGQYIENNLPAPTAEDLMRSRYTAYTLKHADYLLKTWHASTRPQSIDLAEDKTQWIGLDVKRHEQTDSSHAIVEFVARYKINGRAQRLHETSRFVKEGDNWFYVDGVVA